MAKETKTVQCYPSDERINAMIERYQAFGWELINNQRCQEYDGQTYEGDTRVSHYSTFNKLTFTRDKGEEWYGEVTALERDYESLDNECRRYKNLEPDTPTTSSGYVLSLIAGILILAGVLNFILAFTDKYYTIGYILGPVFLVLGILRFILRAVRKNIKWKKYGEEKAEWKDRYGEKIEELEKQMKELMRKAERLVN